MTLMIFLKKHFESGQKVLNKVNKINNKNEISGNENEKCKCEIYVVF